MATIDLRQFVWRRAGEWSNVKDSNTFSPSLLRLSHPSDSVTLNGPVSLHVSIQVRNQFSIHGENADQQSSRLSSYRLNVPPGQSWTYTFPERGEATLFAISANSSFEVWIEPAVGGVDYYDKLGVDPYQSHTDCGCNHTPCTCKPAPSSDLPCDFAVGNNSRVGEFFPSACEPCAPGSFVHMKPLAGPRLTVPPAPGGCTRTNYFNGMFITKEDLLTDQRNMRIKQQLQNRAMGQGVVWGLDLFRDGGAIGVRPGYAVDCCGNDITITSDYKVDANSLVQDPAAAAELSQKGPHRMHLLLEYFECPEDPRPVHGDVCSPETTHCEMGRIRETARLRLVPPRDLDTSGPIADFLKSIPNPTVNGDDLSPPDSELVTPRIGTNAPFDLHVDVTKGLQYQLGPQLDFQLQPAFGQTIDGLTKRANIADIQQEPSIEVKFSFRIPQGSATQFLSLPNITRLDSSPDGISPTVKLSNDAFPSNDVTGSILMGTRNFRASTGQTRAGFVKFSIDSWTVVLQDETRPIATGTSTLTIAWQVVAPTEAVDMNVSVETEGRTRAPRFPCMTEACDPKGGPLLPVTPPWMHDFPNGSGSAIDAQVLSAEWNFVAFLGRGETNPTLAGIDQRLFNPLGKLFGAWCRESLYRGPRCAGDPHGVVIGCAVVEGGRITSVDPWGGRRWILHYPLLTQWTGLAGVAPLDYLASKLFEFICCIASHGQRLPQRPPTPMLTAAEPSRSDDPFTHGIALGTSLLYFDSRENVVKQMKGAQITFANLELSDFLSRALSAITKPTTQPIGETATVYFFPGLNRVFLVVPTEQGPNFNRRSPTPSAVSRHPINSEPIRAFVRTQNEAAGDEQFVPRLLRSFTEDLAIRILQSTHVIAPSDAESAIVERLKTSHITSVADLLSADVEQLHSELLKGKTPEAFAKVLESNDQLGQRVVAGVSSAVHKQSQQGLNVRADLTDKTLMRKFAKTLNKQLAEVKTDPPMTEKSIMQLIGELSGGTS